MGIAKTSKEIFVIFCDDFVKKVVRKLSKIARKELNCINLKCLQESRYLV